MFNWLSGSLFALPLLAYHGTSDGLQQPVGMQQTLPSNDYIFLKDQTIRSALLSSWTGFFG